MKLFWRDQGPRLRDYLEEFRAAPFSPPVEGATEENISAVVTTRPQNLRECNLEFLFRYRIFPPRRLTFFGEWERDDRLMRVGDTIVLQAQVPPGWGLHVVFGVRVVAVFHEADRAGFRYRTLAGHPESGENEFLFVRHLEHDLTARVHTQSGFSSSIIRIFAPVFGRPFVRSSNRSALAQMTAAFRAANPGLKAPDADAPDLRGGGFSASR